MAQKPLTDEQLREVLAAVKTHGGVTAAAKVLGIPRNTADSRYQAAKRRFGDEAEEPQDKERFEDTIEGERRNINSISSRIRTLEDAMAYAEVDPKVWVVEKFKVNSYECPAKIATWEDGVKVNEELVSKGLWQITASFVRIAPKYLTDAFDLIHERALKHAPRYPKLPKLKPPRDPHMLEVCLFDAHFGKLAWHAETGSNYDLKIAEAVYLNAVQDLLGYVSSMDFDRIVFPIGNDFCHIDNLRNQTTAGTDQDVDGRYAKIIDTAFAALQQAIDWLMQRAPVEVILVPGNHDRQVSHHLARELAAWYRTTDRVSVDYELRDRKYVRYGCVLLGYTHGSEEKLTDLPNIMATEESEAWAATRVHEWHVGHRHRKGELRTAPVASHHGVCVVTIPSLSGTDAWHYRKGFIGSARAAEAYVWSAKQGFAGKFQASAREQ